jgi:hypothetical protein
MGVIHAGWFQDNVSLVQCNKTTNRRRTQVCERHTSLCFEVPTAKRVVIGRSYRATLVENARGRETSEAAIGKAF